MSDYFSDVPQDNPHTDSIDWLYEKDITKGLFPGIYGPAAPVSRDQADGEPLAANSPAPGEWNVTVG